VLAKKQRVESLYHSDPSVPYCSTFDADFDFDLVYPRPLSKVMSGQRKEEMKKGKKKD